MLSTRNAICCLVVCVYLVAAKCNGEGYEKAPNCARNECPEYAVVHTQTEFEIRSYKDARWVYGPTISSTSYKAAAGKGFQILLDYYRGMNHEKMVVNMTSPVLVGVDNSSHTVYFYLPKMYQTFAPRPLMPGIKPVNLPLPGHKYAAVRRFGGMISDESIPTNLDALKKSLQSSPDYQRAADGRISMLAAYNSPRELTNRVNEVFIWFD